MWIFAAACIGIGVFLGFLYVILPYPVAYEPYTAAHLVAQFQLLLFAGLAFFVMLPMMQRTLTISLDWDWFYRRFGRILGREFADLTAAVQRAVATSTLRRVDSFVQGIIRTHGPKGILSRTWPTGSMVLWVAILLGTYLILSL